MLLLTAVEFDHADIYRDLDAVKAAFRKLLGLLRPGAPLVACGDFPHVLDVVDGDARRRSSASGSASATRGA